MKPDAAALGEAIDSFVAFIYSLPPPRLEPNGTGRWGPREVLTHLVFWHERYLQIAADAIAGRQREMLQGTFKEINHGAVAKNISVPVEELFCRWIRAHQKLTTIARTPEGAHLKFSLRKGSKEWPLPVLIGLAARHIANHETRLRKLLVMPQPRRRSAALI